MLNNNIIIQCICLKQPINEVLIQCGSCKLYQHKTCVKDAIFMERYECPTCQIRKSDIFIKTLGQLAEPFVVKNEKRSFTKTFTFNHRITDFRTSKKENSKFIMIRSLKLGSTGYSMQWPYNTTISVNKEPLMKVELTQLYARTRVDYPIVYVFDNQDAKDNNYHKFNAKYFRPTCILKDLNEITVVNNLDVNPDDKSHYVVFIELVEVVKDISDLTKSIRVETDMEKLKAFYFPIEEIESFDVNLIDCYEEKLIKLPARGELCSHPDVFDLQTYLLASRTNKRFACPLCKKKTSDIYVDGFIQKLIEENATNAKLTILRDLSIKKAQSCKKDNQVNCIDLTGSEENSIENDTTEGTNPLNSPKHQETVYKKSDKYTLVNDKANKGIFDMFGKSSSHPLFTTIINKKVVTNIEPLGKAPNVINKATTTAPKDVKPLPTPTTKAPNKATPTTVSAHSAPDTTTSNEATQTNNNNDVSLSVKMNSMLIGNRKSINSDYDDFLKKNKTNLHSYDIFNDIFLRDQNFSIN
jgi:hypothetical protein